MNAMMDQLTLSLHDKPRSKCHKTFVRSSGNCPVSGDRKVGEGFTPVGLCLKLCPVAAWMC